MFLNITMIRVFIIIWNKRGNFLRENNKLFWVWTIHIKCKPSNEICREIWSTGAAYYFISYTFGIAFFCSILCFALRTFIIKGLLLIEPHYGLWRHFSIKGADIINAMETCSIFSLIFFNVLHPINSLKSNSEWGLFITCKENVYIASQVK